MEASVALYPIKRGQLGARRGLTCNGRGELTLISHLALEAFQAILTACADENPTCSPGGGLLLMNCSEL